MINGLTMHVFNSKVWVLTSGTGEDGNEIELLGIYSSQGKALEAKTWYERLRSNAGHTPYRHTANDPYEYEIDSEMHP